MRSNSFFDNFYRVVGTAVAKLVVTELRDINKKLDKLHKLMADINADLAQVKSDLDEGMTEILALIEQLQGETLTDEGRANLEAIKAKATALKEIVPNPPEG